MINVQCSRLEEVRKNHNVFVQQLLSDEKSTGGRGMLQAWQNKVKSIHTAELEVSEALKELQQSFLGFKDNAVNRKRQEFLIDRLYVYVEEFGHHQLSYHSSEKLIKWPILKDVALSGKLPFLACNGKSEYYLYYFFEKTTQWREQLKYPLLQQYLAKILNCETSAINVGIYCLEENCFDIKVFDKGELENALEETKLLFSKIRDDYNHRIKNAG